MSGLNYTLSGDAGLPPILFLHGFMGSALDWDAVLENLSKQYHCIAVDLPGHGESLGLSPESYTMEGTALSVVEALNDLDIGRATLVGYSMGGRLALYLTLRYPERCAGLFLESASPGLEGAEEREARREADERLAKRLETGDFEEFLRDWYRQPLFASLARDEELLHETIEARRSNDPSELAKSLRGMGTGSQPSLWEELPGLRVPALAVAGELDEKYIEIARWMALLGSRIHIAAIPGVGHNVRTEAPEECLILLRTFLLRLSETRYRKGIV